MARFGRYRLLEQLGCGGMAVVNRAIADGPKGFERELVVKRILREHSHDPHVGHMLATEARLSARLRHPNIVQVYDFGEVGDEYYLVMEMIDGVDLGALVRGCRQRQLRLPLGVVCWVIGQVASALAYAHQLTDETGKPLGIIHRDVSPSNIMVTQAGAVKLLDFGIAKATDAVRAEQTRTRAGSLKGKLSYLSPEQCEGRELDPRSDIFSLGIVFYELVTLQKLFRGNTDLEIMHKVREANVRPLGDVAKVPPEVESLVMRMLSRNARDRFADCEQIAAALATLSHKLEGDGLALRRFLTKLGPLSRGQAAPAQPEGTAQKAAARPKSGSLKNTFGEAQAVPAAKPPFASASPAWMATTAAAVLVAAMLGGQVRSLRRLTAPRAAAPSSRAAAATAPTTTRPSATRPTVTPSAVTPSAPSPSAPSPSAPSPKLDGVPAAAEAAPSASTAPIARTAPAAAPRPEPRPARKPAQPAHDVRLSLTGTERAEVLLDGKPIGAVPLQLRLPRRSSPRAIMVRRPGFKPWHRVLDGQRDVALVVVLEREATAPIRPPATRISGSVLADPFE